MPTYAGPIRDGAYGSTKISEIRRCSGCGVERLDESACLIHADYETGRYRSHLDQASEIDTYYRNHDELARFTLDTIWPFSLRNKVVADVGCGGGSLFDHIRGLPNRLIAIDPAVQFAPSLRARGYEWYPSIESAFEKVGGTVDVVFSIQVIEHVSDPLDFLKGIRRLLAPDGIAVISTPNRADILMDLLPDAFPEFFYRVQHRWYFTAPCLERFAISAGLKVDQFRYVHRYGIANTLLWLRDRRPAGRAKLSILDEQANSNWKA
jgi:SAM-dependent methyltransferase